MENNKKWFFSLFSGELYQVNESEIKFLDGFQIPLKDKPSERCSKCRGKFRTEYYITEKRWFFCKRCAKKLVDYSTIKPSNRIVQ